MKVLALAPHNQALFDYILLHQPVTAKAIFATFAGAGESDSRFRKRLTYLHSRGWLLLDGRGARAVWSINPHQLPGVALAPKKPTPAACALGPVTQSARYNIFTAPAYVPPRMGTARAGALDFAKCASHGTRC